MDRHDTEQSADKEKWYAYVQDAGVDANNPLSVTYWKETLPLVWVSIPKPNKMDVNIYIYYQAGNGAC